ncbi:YhbY family RNA-binding protein [Orrella sp. JC864]|uniref:YhbY family RNA-binding protein n=1 Tax=Orrella sp. JC864 TaxID=3120298 RepID=UPI0012BD4117
MPNLEITPRERSELRAAAHSLRPVVLIGDNGLTEAVLKEIDRALSAHGLIKVRAGGEDRDARETMLAGICDALSCAAVHHLGKMLILYRPTAQELETRAQPQTRALRKKASDPHVPKKQAAAGRTAPKRPARAAKPAVEPVRRDPYETERPARPSTRVPLKKKTAATPRKTGSALSLRAGARRGTQRATATSRRPSKATSK